MSLHGCIDESSDSSGPSPNGFFTGVIISGLSYTTQTQSGITDARGGFVFEDGETITFSVGATQVGETVTAKAEMTLFDLLPNAPLYTKEAQSFRLYYRPVYNSERLLHNHLRNIVIFMHSLDADRNINNGITINADMRQLMVNVDLKISKMKFNFGLSNKYFNVLLVKAKKAGFIEHGRVTNTGIAMEDFYRLYGIDHVLTVKGTIATDISSSGSVNSSMVHTYDEAGNRTDENSYTGTDTLIFGEKRTYDEFGQWLTEERYSSDGVVNYRATNTVDEFGNLTQATIDNDGDGTLDTRRVYVNNENGMRQSVTEYNGDTITKVTTYTYKDEYLTHTVNIDEGNNGVTDTEYSYIYNSNNHFVGFEYNKAAAGATNYVQTMTVNDDGNFLTLHYQATVDGAHTQSYTSTYDGFRNVTRKETDNDSDGVIDEVISYTYNDGFFLLSEERYAGSGGAETYSRYKEYDDNDNLLRDATDSNGDGAANKLIVYTYDNNLLATKTEESTDGGTTNRHSVYGYDENDNLIQQLKTWFDRTDTITYTPVAATWVTMLIARQLE